MDTHNDNSHGGRKKGYIPSKISIEKQKKTWQKNHEAKKHLNTRWR